MSTLRHLFPTRPFRFLLISLIAIALTIGAIAIRPAFSTQSQTPTGSLLYGKIADTRHGIGSDSNIAQHAKVMINSIPPQTVYTDDKGQFWFKGLRDISYTIQVELPYDRQQHYAFTTKVNGETGKFFDIAAEHQHNRHEVDY
jgi:hypothetical protein